MSIDPQRLHNLTEPDWTRARENAVLRRLDAAPQRSYGPALVVATAVALAAGLIAFVIAPRWSTPPGRAEPVAIAPPTVVPLQFRDGTLVSPHDEHSDVVVASATDDHTEVVLRRGGAHFDVTPNPKRRFRINAGLVTVDVLGTEFDCRRDVDRVRVEVLRGRVAVSWPGGSRELGRGEAGVFPPLPTDTRPAPPPKPKPHSVDPPPESDVEAEPAPEVPGTKRPRAEQLMQSADRARRGGKHALAISTLKRVLREHPKDPRAAAAAFTIGRLELARKNYGAAARYFARVRAMGQPSLAEHALAREVEAWSSAGRRAKAERRAAEYLRRFPKGPHSEQVRQLVSESGG